MILEISNPLLLGNQSDDVARVHQVLRVLGRSIPIDETANRVLGPQTVAVLKALQADLGVAATGIVDAATVRLINAKLAKLPTDTHVVRGIVRDANRNPATTGFVLLHLQSPAGEQVLGKSPLDAATGAYRITYKPPPDSAGRLDLRIEVHDANGPVETTPSGASILTGAGPLEVVDFVLSGEKNAPPSEFEQIPPRSQTAAGTTRLGKRPAGGQGTPRHQPVGGPRRLCVGTDCRLGSGASVGTRYPDSRARLLRTPAPGAALDARRAACPPNRASA